MDLSRVIAEYGTPENSRHVSEPDPSLPEDVGTVLRDLGGVSLNGGLYRCHPPAAVHRMTELAVEAFPDFRGRVVCFGVDWLGRQFASDSARRAPDGGHLVLLLEPGTGEALEIPSSVVGFNETGLVDYAEPALARSFYEAWRAQSGDSDPLGTHECVGYIVPLFLGGSDDLSNLQRTDLETYWTLMGQARLSASTLPEGTPIQTVQAEGAE